MGKKSRRRRFYPEFYTDEEYEKIEKEKNEISEMANDTDDLNKQNEADTKITNDTYNYNEYNGNSMKTSDRSINPNIYEKFNAFNLPDTNTSFTPQSAANQINLEFKRQQYVDYPYNDAPLKIIPEEEYKPMEYVDNPYENENINKNANSDATTNTYADSDENKKDENGGDISENIDIITNEYLERIHQENLMSNIYNANNRENAEDTNNANSINNINNINVNNNINTKNMNVNTTNEIQFEHIEECPQIPIEETPMPPQIQINPQMQENIPTPQILQTPQPSQIPQVLQTPQNNPEPYFNSLKPYNREDAVKYAHRWALDKNPAYYDYEDIGGDCTNFASQTLFAGGCKMNFTPTYGWYYKTGNDKSPSWTGVEYLYNFLVQNDSDGPVGREIDISEAEPGDLVNLSFNGKNYQHCPVIVKIKRDEKGKINPDGIFICAHSFSCENRPLDTYNWRKIRFVKILGTK